MFIFLNSLTVHSRLLQFKIMFSLQYSFLLLIALTQLSVQVRGVLRHISDDELKSFTEALLEIDSNNAANYVKLNLQLRSPYNSTEDLSPEMLLSVNSDAYQLSTVSKLIKLYDNYIPNTLTNEEVTPEELREEKEFMKALLGTTIMSKTRTFLSSKGMAPSTPEEFSNFLQKLWFTIYSREKQKRGSSAFEHVFLGEFKRGQVSGLHNWLFFAQEEKLKHLNYFGWIKKIEFPKKKGGIIKLKYSWNGLLKLSGSMFVGTSPEFEISLYTVCFLARPNDRCKLAVGTKTFSIQTYSFTYHNNTLISSAYPHI